MGVIEFSADNTNDEATQYQIGCYVNSNEVFWWIFSFPIYERYPTVVH
jgi:hypothetical protein